MSDDRPKFHFEEENAEGDFPTSFRFDNVEIKKGERIVATELNDLYDVDIETDPPNEGDALIYDASLELWVPGSISGGCSLISGTLRMFVYIHRYDYVSSYGRDYDYSNPFNVHPINGTFDTSQPIGSFLNPFKSIDLAFNWLQENCYTISNNAKVEMIVLCDGPLELWVSWDNEGSAWIDWTPVTINYAYANRVFIYGANVDGLSSFAPSMNLSAWENSLNVLPIQYKMIGDFTYEGSSCGSCGSYSECDVFYDNIIDAMKPYINIPPNKTLGGLYNFKFLQSDFDISCDSGGSYT